MVCVRGVISGYYSARLLFWSKVCCCSLFDSHSISPSVYIQSCTTSSLHILPSSCHHHIVPTAAAVTTQSQVPLASADGDNGAYRLLSQSSIEAELEAILAHAATQADASSLPPPVGALTCGERAVWEEARAKLGSTGEGAATLAEIDEALLVLAIDDSPEAVRVVSDGKGFLGK